MPNKLTKSTGKATIAGTTVYTVPAGTTATIIGLRATNTDTTAYHWVTISVAGFLVSPAQVRLPVGGGYEFTEGSKIVAEEGETIIVSSDTDNDIDIYISMLEQS